VNRRAASFVLGLALALLIGAGVWWWLSGRASGPGGRSAQEESAQPTEKVTFQLYFPGDGGLLRAEPRELAVSNSPKDRIRKVVEALLAGPQGRGLARPFPEGVTVGSVQLSGDGVAYVDLRWQDHNEPPSGGSTEEMQRVYSVVNSITANVPQALRVVLLWNGLQRPTFSGHLDMSEPLAPNQALAGR
jgi:spore germination protein GerM